MSAYQSEDTSEHAGGCTPCGYNGSLQPYRHDGHVGCKPSAERKAAMADIRLRLLVRAAAEDAHARRKMG